MIIRTEKDKNNPFVRVSRDLIEDERLTIEARFLMVYCLSKPDNWEFHISHLGLVLKQGRDKMRRLVAELVKIGYCVVDQRRNKGMFDKNFYIMREFPEGESPFKERLPKTEKPAPVEPLTDEPLTAKRPLVTNDIQVTIEEKVTKEHTHVAVTREKFGADGAVRLTPRELELFKAWHAKEKCLLPVERIIEDLNDSLMTGRYSSKSHLASLRTFARRSSLPSSSSVGRPAAFSPLLYAEKMMEEVNSKQTKYTLYAGKEYATLEERDKPNTEKHFEYKKGLAFREELDKALKEKGLIQL